VPGIQQLRSAREFFEEDGCIFNVDDDRLGIITN
jgi:hypothetical protein